jgi:hypothetical protein
MFKMAFTSFSLLAFAAGAWAHKVYDSKHYSCAICEKVVNL